MENSNPKKEINDIDQLKNELLLKQIGEELVPQVENLNINFEINLPIEIPQNKITNYTKNTFRFANCSFNKLVTFSKNSIEGKKNNYTKFFFFNCDFTEIKWTDVIFEKKIRFHKCNFNRKLIVDNTTFKGLADFWSSIFKERVIFYKVNFEDVTVLSSVIFEKNVLFTYSTIKKLLILRGTTVIKGMDLSLAIIEGDLLVFDFKLGKFKTIKVPKRTGNWLETYDGITAEKGDIFITNKRETYRIIKNQLINQKNTIDATQYSYLENRTLRQEIWQKIFPFNFRETNFKKWNTKTIVQSIKKLKFINVIKSVYKFLFNWLSAISNYSLLFLNRISNRHGTSYVLGVFFTFSIGALFYYLSMIYSGKYSFNYEIDYGIIKKDISTYLQFMMPTHKFNYLGNDFIKNNVEKGNHYMFYFWDILGRIFVGYGIYQTIQAFRKYKK